MYKITLSDGTIFDNLELNGDNFISQDEINISVFENNCSPVSIFDGNNTKIHQAMALVHVTKMENEWWFSLRDLSETELDNLKTRSDVDYIALMCDIDL